MLASLQLDSPVPLPAVLPSGLTCSDRNLSRYGRGCNRLNKAGVRDDDDADVDVLAVASPFMAALAAVAMVTYTQEQGGEPAKLALNSVRPLFSHAPLIILQ